MKRKRDNLMVTLLLVIIYSSYLVIEAKFILSLSWVQKSGQFSWFYPKIELGHEPIETESFQNQKDEDQTLFHSEDLDINGLIERLPKHFPFLEEEISSSYHSNCLRYCIEKAFSSFHYWKGEKYRIVLTEDYSVIISQRLWPIGWRHYPFKIYLQENDQKEENSEDFLLNFIPLSNHRSLQQFLLRVKLGASQKKKGSSKKTLLTSEIYHSKNIPASLPKSLFEPLLYHLKKLLQEKYRLHQIRRVQQEQYDQVSQTAEEKRKKQELDKIIHPEKYKTKVPIVRDSSGQGSGRYVPSAATQARRQVRSGG